MTIGLFFIVLGAVFIWLALQGWQSGRIRYKIFATERAVSPIWFWIQVAAYCLIGLGLLVDGISIMFHQ